MRYNILRRTKQKPNTKRIYGFDIETVDDNKTFYCASVWGDDFVQTFRDKDNLIRALMSGFFRDSIIVATNLSFDFFGVFFGTDAVKDFRFTFRGSELIYAKTYNYNGRFNAKSDRHKSSITFLDTCNYAKISVEKLGKILGLPKLKHPACLGRRPKDEAEEEELITYNLRDSEISCKALKFLYSEFERLGATPKMTIASTAMSLFRNRYLKDDYITHEAHHLRELFKGYYGGRTEAFRRGRIKDRYYYDFNSLYPSVMMEEFPDPNTMRRTTKNDVYYINNFEGMSEVTINCPSSMHYPLLPVKTKSKLIFPTGTFRGFYTHVELRRAMELGYTLMKVHVSYSYTGKCRPFEGYVRDMYEYRQRFKKAGNPAELVVKLLMNGLYGKFGQKFDDKDNIIPFNHTAEDLHKLDRFEIIGDGDYIRIKENRPPASFCIPIWASYVTAYGRIKLHTYMLMAKPDYVDTDSLITSHRFEESSQLGKLKLEMFVTDGIIVKPKFYMVNGDVKIKGVGVKVSMRDFGNLMENPEVRYPKFMKLRESLRRGLIPNEIIETTKELSLEDNKRHWLAPFSHMSAQDSIPLDVRDIDRKDILEETLPALQHLGTT